MFLSFSPPIRFIEKPMCICTTDLHTRESVDHFLRRRSASGAARRAPRIHGFGVFDKLWFSDVSRLT